MANVEKLEAVLDYIRTHPDEHDQSTWAGKGPCGTTLCFAGTAVVLAGYEILWGALAPDSHLCQRGSDVRSISSVAATDLELSPRRAIELFLNSPAFGDVERKVKDICNEQSP